LHVACAQGCTTTIKTLLQAGANLEIQDEIGSTALHYAVEYGNRDVVYFIVDHYTTQKDTPLKELLSIFFYRDLITMILEYYNYDGLFILLSLQNIYGRIPLKIAESLGYYDLTRYLKEKERGYTLSNIIQHKNLVALPKKEVTKNVVDLVHNQ
jgi:ankyrin repeat protein